MTGSIEEGLEKIQVALAEYTKAIVDAIGKAKPQMPLVQAGNADLVNGDSAYFSEVSFPKPFPGVPVIVATAVDPQSGVQIPVHVLTATNAGFRCAHAPMPYRETRLNWVATMGT